MLWRCTCHGRIVITCCSPPSFKALNSSLYNTPLPDLKSCCSAYLLCCKLSNVRGTSSFHTHRLHLCAYALAAKYREMWKWSQRGSYKKGMQREAGGKTRRPYLAPVDNASRRCKLDKEWLSWRLDVAQWWFAANLTTFVVWPLPSRRCYYESERDEWDG